MCLYDLYLSGKIICFGFYVTPSLDRKYKIHRQKTAKFPLCSSEPKYVSGLMYKRTKSTAQFFSISSWHAQMVYLLRVLTSLPLCMWASFPWHKMFLGLALKHSWAWLLHRLSYIHSLCQITVTQSFIITSTAITLCVSLGEHDSLFLGGSHLWATGPRFGARTQSWRRFLEEWNVVRFPYLESHVKKTFCPTRIFFPTPYWPVTMALPQHATHSTYHPTILWHTLQIPREKHSGKKISASKHRKEFRYSSAQSRGTKKSAWQVESSRYSGFLLSRCLFELHLFSDVCFSNSALLSNVIHRFSSITFSVQAKSGFDTLRRKVHIHN